ncbi:MAG: RiPP maturation radical SAM C-methyltransferase [Litorimonas sp.]
MLLRHGTGPKVGLVSLPWTSLNEPALGLGVLKACLSDASIPAKVFHSHIDLLSTLSADTYHSVAQTWAINDLLFTQNLTGDLSTSQRRHLETHVRDESVRHSMKACGYESETEIVELFNNLRNRLLPAYIDRTAKTLLRYSPTMIGVTCLFDQTFAALSLATALREKGFTGLIALGGYSVSGDVAQALLQRCTAIDAVAQGAGEQTIIDLAHASVGKTAMTDIPGLLHRGSEADRVPLRRYPIEASPKPDYADWFSDISALQSGACVHIETETLPIELSRGCWWGQKNHCIFCGISPEAMPYTYKPANIALEQIKELVSDYGGAKHVRFNDYILPLSYIDGLVPDLEAINVNFGCETKANLKPKQMYRLRKAGFDEIQPGIESFSHEVLKTMKKGVDPIQNIAFLVIGKALGIQVFYNILFDFPGDRAEDYAWMMDMLPSLYHLQPPLSAVPVQITRDAPLHRFAADYGALDPPRPAARYSVLEAGVFDADFIESYSYYFEKYHDTNEAAATTFRALKDIVEHWYRVSDHGSAALDFQATAMGATVTDTRFGRKVVRVLCHRQVDLLRSASPGPAPYPKGPHTDTTDPLSLDTVRAEIEQLVEWRLLIHDGRKMICIVPALAERRFEGMPDTRTRVGAPA